MIRPLSERESLSYRFLHVFIAVGFVPHPRWGFVFRARTLQMCVLLNVDDDLLFRYGFITDVEPKNAWWSSRENES